MNKEFVYIMLLIHTLPQYIICNIFYKRRKVVILLYTSLVKRRNCIMTKKFRTKVLGVVASLCIAFFAVPMAASATGVTTISPAASPAVTPEATPKPKVEISIGSEFKKVYDGREVSKSDVLALVSDKSGNGVSKFTYKWYDKDGDQMSKNPVDAGVYKLKITVSEKDPVYTGKATVKYIIEPRPLEWDTSNLIAAKPSDGTAAAPKVRGDLKLTGIVDGDDAKFSYDSIKAADFPSADVQRTMLQLTVENAQLEGDDADNYTMPKQSPEIEAYIRKAHITEITFPGDNNKYRAVVEETVYANDVLGDNGYGTADLIKEALKAKAAENWTDKEDINAVYYTAVLQVNKDGEWVDVTAENNPADGAAVVLPYPEGTKNSSHEFVVYKMKTQGDDAGLIEVWAHTEKVEGLEVTLSQGEPMIVVYAPAGAVSKDMLFAVGGVVAAAVAAAVFFKLLKKDREDMAEETAESAENTDN